MNWRMTNKYDKELCEERHKTIDMRIEELKEDIGKVWGRLGRVQAIGVTTLVTLIGVLVELVLSK